MALKHHEAHEEHEEFMEFDDLSKTVIGCALEVHRTLGPGLLESAYEKCLAHELTILKVPFCVQVPIPIVYKGIELDCGYRADMIVKNSLLLELKSVEALLPIHEAQLLTYMKLANIRTGLLMNFNVQLLRDGLRRFVL